MNQAPKGCSNHETNISRKSRASVTLNVVDGREGVYGVMAIKSSLTKFEAKTHMPTFGWSR